MDHSEAMQQSAAWAALPRSARRVYAAIAAEIAASGGDTAAVTQLALMTDHHLGAPGQALRLLRYLRLIEVSAGRRLVTVYKLSEGYRALGADEVARLVALAREVRPRSELSLGNRTT
jgi:hypothetical protein